MGAGAVAAKWRGFASRRVFGANFGFQRFEPLWRLFGTFWPDFGLLWPRSALSRAPEGQ